MRSAFKAMREAADAGLADISAGRFSTFDSASMLEKHLSALSESALADLPSNVDAGP